MGDYFSGSQYFPESNFVLVDTAEMLHIFRNVNPMPVYSGLFAHELSHSVYRFSGEVRNRIKNSLMVITELFQKPNDEDRDIDTIIRLELANLILHRNSIKLQEAYSAYQIYFMEKNRKLFMDDEMDEGRKLEKKHGKKVIERGRKRILKAASVTKEAILSDKKVKKNYDNLVWLSETFNDYMLPSHVGDFSFDLRYDIHPNLIISKDPATDSQWRFDRVIQSIKILDKHGKKNLVPQSSPPYVEMTLGEAAAKANRCKIFLGKLTGLGAGILDSYRKGVLEQIRKIQFYPSQIPINSNSVFPPVESIPSFDIYMDAFFEFVRFTIWTGFKMTKEEIMLVPNSKFVPDEILMFWLKHFYIWLLKECVIGRYDVDFCLSLFPTLKILDSEETRTATSKAKLLQETLEFEKAYDYDVFDKLRKKR